MPTEDGEVGGTGVTAQKVENRDFADHFQYLRASCVPCDGCAWPATLFEAKRFDRVERGCPIGRIESEPDTDS